MKIKGTEDYIRVAVIAIGSLLGQVFLVAKSTHPAIEELRRASKELLVTLPHNLWYDVAPKDLASAKEAVKTAVQETITDVNHSVREAIHAQTHDHPEATHTLRRSTGWALYDALPEHLRASHYIVIELLLIILLTFTAGVLTGNYSQVDKIWSLTPALFAWTYAVLQPTNARLTLMALVISVWAIRLTLNFNRRGGYTWPPWLGEEDYRWKHVQDFLNAKQNKVLWHLFHFGFIVVTQNILLFLICLPSHFVWFDALTHVPGALDEWDFVATALILLLVLGEALTDDAQYHFQEKKYELLRKRKPLHEPYAQGFLSTGMFALSRHMNYFCEQSIWLALNLYIYPATGGRELVTSAVMGFVLLALLFQGSIWLQEQNTAEKWPLYEEYIKQVPQLLPIGHGFVPPSNTRGSGRKQN